MPATAQTVTLSCHPATPSEAVRRLEVLVTRAADGAFSFGYHIEADAGRLRIPPPRPARRADGLWQHTCCEAFVSGGGAGYYELNFAPSTEWALYAFSGYREGMSPVELPAGEMGPNIDIHQTERGLELDAAVRTASLPQLQDSSRLRLGLAAVIEEEGGRLSYWALAHPSGKPDFHHPAGFVLEL